jgi:hypothetical protein
MHLLRVIGLSYQPVGYSRYLQLTCERLKGRQRQLPLGCHVVNIYYEYVS